MFFLRRHIRFDEIRAAEWRKFFFVVIKLEIGWNAYLMWASFAPRGAKNIRQQQWNDADSISVVLLYQYRQGSAWAPCITKLCCRSTIRWMSTHVLHRVNRWHHRGVSTQDVERTIVGCSLSMRRTLENHKWRVNRGICCIDTRANVSSIVMINEAVM